MSEAEQTRLHLPARPRERVPLCICLREYICHVCRKEIAPHSARAGVDWSDNVHRFCPTCFDREVLE